MRLVHVEWLDAKSVDEWTDIDALKQGPVVCRSAGLLLYDEETFITLSVAVTDTRQACCTLTIPRGCIQSITDLTLGEEINLSAG